MFGVFFQSTRQVCNDLYLNLKNCTQNANFLQKVDFCIFEPQNREVIENSSKTPLNFSPLQCTYLGENSFQYHLGLVRKKEIEKWLLRTSVQCISIPLNKQASPSLQLFNFKCIEIARISPYYTIIFIM